MYKVHLEEPSLLVIIGTLEGGADLPGRSCLYMQTVEPWRNIFSKDPWRITKLIKKSKRMISCVDPEKYFLKVIDKVGNEFWRKNWFDLQLEKAEGKQGWSSSCWVGGDFWLEAVFTCDWLLLIIFQDFGCCCVIFVWRLNVISSSRLSQKTCLDINTTWEDHSKTSSAASEH